MKKKTSRRRIDVNVEELDRIIDGAMREPLNETDGRTLKTAVHAMAEKLLRSRNTEKTGAVLGEQGSPAPAEEEPAETNEDTNENKPAGHGRNGAHTYRGAEKVEVAHQSLQSGNRCPDCGRGNVYEQKEPKVLVRIVGQAPLAATVYELERLRCLCLMRHRQRYAASLTMPPREFVNLDRSWEERSLASRHVPRCGIIGMRVTGL